MKTVYTYDGYSSFLDAFDWELKMLHDTVMSEECGIESYKTDFLHDVYRITVNLCRLSHIALQYKAVIGTRQSGTCFARENIDYYASKDMLIKGVGILFEQTIGDKVRISVFIMEPSEIAGFLDGGE